MFAKLINQTINLFQEQVDGSFPVVGNDFGPYLVFDENQQAFVVDQALKTQYETNISIENKKAKRISLMTSGQQILATIVELNSDKIASGALTLPQIKTMARDPDLVEIKDLLHLGDLKGAKYAIQNYSGVYYTEAEKAAIISQINQILGV